MKAGDALTSPTVAKLLAGLRLYSVIAREALAERLGLLRLGRVSMDEAQELNAQPDMRVTAMGQSRQEIRRVTPAPI